MNLTTDDLDTLMIACASRMHRIAENPEKYWRFDQRMDGLREEIAKLQLLIAATEAGDDYQVAYAALHPKNKEAA